jgi:hypothetical protein
VSKEQLLDGSPSEGRRSGGVSMNDRRIGDPLNLLRGLSETDHGLLDMSVSKTFMWDSLLLWWLSVCDSREGWGR